MRSRAGPRLISVVALFVVTPRPGRPVRRCLWIIVLSVQLVASAVADQGFEVLVRLYYDVEVMSFCGGGSAEVMAGFRRERLAVMRRHGLRGEQDDKARFEAARRADSEWKNRGLGGFRHWCRQQGQAAVRRFSAPLPSGRY